MRETFKDIPGYEGLYQISNLGRIKSFRYNKEKILKLDKDKHGYFQIKLFNKIKRKSNKIHRLVILSFIGESNLDVNHIDGNKQNNNINNLEYVTHRENMQHAWRNNLINNNSQKIKVKQYDKQGNFIKEYESILEAEKQTNINQGNISLCVSSKRKSAGGYIWRKA